MLLAEELNIKLTKGYVLHFMFSAGCCGYIDDSAVEEHLLGGSEGRVSGLRKHVVDKVLLRLSTQIDNLYVSTKPTCR
jgi:hypothetical protein